MLFAETDMEELKVVPSERTRLKRRPNQEQYRPQMDSENMLKISIDICGAHVEGYSVE